MGRPWTPYTDRREAVGATVTYGERRYCQRDGKPATVYDLDGSWCSPECRDADRAEDAR